MNPIWRFALRALAWLAPCFALWYLIAPWYDRPAAWLARMLIDAWHDGLVDALEIQPHLVTFVTSLDVHAQGGVGRLLLEVNPLLYGFGAPLLAALLLASRAPWTKLLLGLAALLPFQAWGIAFDFLAQIVRTGAGVSAQAGLLGWRTEFVALAYQVGSLIFPALAPVALWVAFNRPLFGALIGAPAPDMGHHAGTVR